MKENNKDQFRQELWRAKINQKRDNRRTRMKARRIFLVKSQGSRPFTYENNVEIPQGPTENYSQVRLMAMQHIEFTLFPLLEDCFTNQPIYSPLNNVAELKEIQDRFYSHVSGSFMITNILKVTNTYLKFQYELKKIQTMLKYGELSEKLLFHGTRVENVESICRRNFNWRLCKSQRFGFGVNFSPKSSYAAHYCGDTNDKVMILSRVIIGNSCYWTENMPWPPQPYDTVINENENVVVKFEDHSFYPEYLIHFCCM